MKRFIVLFAGLLLVKSSFATLKVIHPTLKASEIFFSIGKTDHKISLLELSEIKVRDFEKLKGYKLNFLERLSFKKVQKRLRNEINLDGTISSKQFEKFVKQRGGESSFHVGGFLLGLFLGPIGVLIAYLHNDDYKRERVNWAWRGFLAAVLIAVAILGAAGI